jgi:simple sugar transport system substrate-binding protein/ribose transport system substrate-binding protein
VNRWIARAVAGLCATTALVGVAACGSSSSSSSTASASNAAASSSSTSSTTAASSSSSGGSSAKVGVDYPRSDTDFWNSYIQYVPKFASQMGLQLITTNSQNDISKLAANVQTLVSQGIKGVVIAPQDTAAVVPTLQLLASKKIPVVSIDTRPDSGNVFMVVRANNRAYGQKACEFLGTQMHGKGKVVMLEGDLASINGRDRTEAFGQCMKQNFAGIKVFGEPSKWDAATAASQLAAVLSSNPDIKGVYMESSFALAGTLQVLKQHGLLAPAGNPKHVFIVSNDGIPQELKDIASGQIDATVSQPADLYAKYGLYYVQAALQGKTFSPGPTDHNSTIIQVRPGLMEDQLAAPLVTRDGASYGGIPSVKSTDTSLWGNNLK